MCERKRSGATDVLVSGTAAVVLVVLLAVVLSAVAGVIEAVAVTILVLCLPAAALTAFFCARNRPPPVHLRRAPARVRPGVRALPAPPRAIEAPVTVTVLPVREEAARGLQR